MERKKSKIVRALFTLLFIVVVQVVIAQTPSKKKIYEAYISTQMSSWELVMTEAEKKCVNLEQYYELVEFQYGYIGWCLSSKLYSKAGYYLNKAESNIDHILKEDPGSSRGYAFKGAFYGFRIALSKFKAIYLGPKSIASIDKAMQLDANNPTAWLEKGNADYYRPAYLGGSKSQAIFNYEKAIFLFEQNQQKLKYNWLYLSTLATLGKALVETGNIKKAKEVYDKIIKIEPNFIWVKYELYPQLIKNKYYE